MTLGLLAAQSYCFTQADKLLCLHTSELLQAIDTLRIKFLMHDRADATQHLQIFRSNIGAGLLY